MEPVSVIIPTFNSQETIAMTLESIFAQKYNAPLEVILVDDGSTDNSLKIAQSFLSRKNFRIIQQKNCGAAAATNTGVNAAVHEIVCSVDADVVLLEAWLKNITEDFKDLQVAAVHGYFITPRKSPLLARIAGYDLEVRYDAISNKYVSHLSSGNTAYRKSALEKVGFFDTRFKYGYDNDMSYRLRKAGYLLVYEKKALCEHYWKTKLKDYMRQQFWSGYGRLQVIDKHKSHFLGDAVSGPRMILHVPIMLVVLFLLSIGLLQYLFQKQALFLLIAFAGLLFLLLERLTFTFTIIKKHRDAACLFLPVVHILRDMVWCWAFVCWSIAKLNRTNEP